MDAVIKNRLGNKFEPKYLRVLADSSCNAKYKVDVVSNGFLNMNILKRHRSIMDVFDSELKSGEIHALEVGAWTEEEHEKKIKNGTGIAGYPYILSEDFVNNI